MTLQILDAFDKHMEQFEWRLKYVKEAITQEMFRAKIEELESQIRGKQHTIDKLSYMLKKHGIQPLNSPHWAEKVPDGFDSKWYTKG